jgi:hypothetical protein
MFETLPRYRSYLLTVWEERNVDPSSPGAWRFSLEDARTGRRRGFAGLEALVAALQQEMAEDQAIERDPATGPADEPGGHRATSSKLKSERR